jgi:hypothetical protein
MGPHPRTRKTAKWLLTALALPLAAATIGSFWYGLLINYSDPSDGVTGSLHVSYGILQWSRYWGNSYRTADFTWNYARLSAADQRPPWTWRFYDPGPIGKHVFLPLWIPAGLGALPGALLWVHDIRMRHRDRAGHCFKCGYDRRGLPSESNCPECGSPAPSGSSDDTGGRPGGSRTGRVTPRLQVHGSP